MSEFIGEIENGIRHALKTKRTVKIRPGPNGAPVGKFDKMQQCGFRIGPDPEDRRVTEIILPPCDFWSDPDGTFHAVQWESL